MRKFLFPFVYLIDIIYRAWLIWLPGHQWWQSYSTLYLLKYKFMKLLSSKAFLMSCWNYIAKFTHSVPGDRNVIAFNQFECHVTKFGKHVSNVFLSYNMKNSKYYFKVSISFKNCHCTLRVSRMEFCRKWDNSDISVIFTAVKQQILITIERRLPDWSELMSIRLTKNPYNWKTF